MSIDAIAVLRIANLPAVEGAYSVRHRGDATLLSTHLRYKTPPDELSAIVYHWLGAQLDAHTDKRGILFYPDVTEPRGGSYDALIREIGDAGIWAPIVSGDHVPLRFTQAAPQTRDWYVGQMMQVVGRDRGLEIDMLAGVYLLQMAYGLQSSAEKDYQQQLDDVVSDMGSEFMRAYDLCLRADVEREVARARQEHERTAAFQEELSSKVASNEPLISQEQMDAVMNDPRIQDLLKKF